MEGSEPSVGAATVSARTNGALVTNSASAVANTLTGFPSKGRRIRYLKSEETGTLSTFEPFPFWGVRPMVIKQTLAGVALLWSVAALAQTGLQGFDRNYPNTPAGDNPRGFTPQVSPLQKPPPPLPAPGDDNERSVANDPFTAPDPMLGEEATNSPADSGTAADAL